jgi:alpha-galactosidase
LVGELPLGCAAVCNASISVQRMAVEAAVHSDLTLLKQAMMMDPLTGAACNPPEIWQMADDMLVAQAEWLPQYQADIPNAKKRLENPEVRTRQNQGAARLHTRSVDEIAEDRVARENAQKTDKAEERPAAKA